MEVARLRVMAESKVKEAEALERAAKCSGDRELRVAARSKRAAAGEYLAEVRRRTGREAFMRGMGVSDA